MDSLTADDNGAHIVIGVKPLGDLPLFTIQDQIVYIDKYILVANTLALSGAAYVFLLSEGGNFAPHPILGVPNINYFTSASSDMVFDKLSPLQFIDGGKAPKMPNNWNWKSGLK